MRGVERLDHDVANRVTHTCTIGVDIEKELRLCSNQGRPARLEGVAECHSIKSMIGNRFGLRQPLNRIVGFSYI